MPILDFDDLFLQAANLRHTGRVNLAIKAYLDIARLAKSDDSRLQARAVHLAGVSAILAVLDAQSSYYRDATIYLEAALDGYQKLNDQASVGIILSDLGLCASAAGLGEKAEDYYRQSLTKLASHEASTEQAITFGRLGLLYIGQQKFEPAERFLNQALTIFRREPAAGFFHAATLLDMAKLNFVQDKIEEAIQDAQLGQSWFEADHEPEEFSYYQAEAAGLLVILHGLHQQKHQATSAYLRFSELTPIFDPLVTKRLNKKMETLVHLRQVFINTP